MFKKLKFKTCSKPVKSVKNSSKQLFLQQTLNEAILHLQSSNIDDAEISARFLMGYLLQLDQAQLISQPQLELSNPEYEQFQSLINRRAKHEPVAYITGETTFCCLPIKINQYVLIPRPETEQLVELVVDYVSSSLKIENLKLKITDVGTGSGAIALALADKLRDQNIEFIATDISKDALALANENAKRLGFDINFLHTDLLSVILSGSEGPLSLSENSHSREILRQSLRMTSIIVANLPYIPTSRIKTLQREVKDYEPLLVLDGGKDGLDYYRKLFRQIQESGSNPQAIFCEIDETHGPLITDLARLHWPQANIKIKKDLAGLDRFAQITLLEH